MSKKENKSHEYEQCVLCHQRTSVKQCTDITYREHYVYGCGQLCSECYDKIYDKSEY